MAFPVPGASSQMQSNMAATLNIDWLLDVAMEAASIGGVTLDRGALLAGMDAAVFAARPASVRRQPRKELKPAMAATTSPMPHGLSRNSESPISSEVEAGILPPRDVRSVFSRGSRNTRKNTITMRRSIPCSFASIFL